MTVWMQVTMDEYELPIYVADSVKELIRLTEAYDDLMPDVAKERSERLQKEAED